MILCNYFILLYIPLLWYVFISNYKKIIQYSLAIIYLPVIIPILKNKYNPVKIWNLLNNKIYGKYVFSFLIGIISPYSYTINPIFKSFTNKECICYINDSFLIRNPFKSIHSVALCNLGELTSGILMIEFLHNRNKKGIITTIECKYFKKARGKITAISKINSFNKTNNTIIANLYDNDDSLICIVKCYWSIK